MKKKYIRPESRLYVINLSENIASSGDGSGDSIDGGMFTINFTQGGNNCREYYSGDLTAPNSKGYVDDFWTYYYEIYGFATAPIPNTYPLTYCLVPLIPVPRI